MAERDDMDPDDQPVTRREFRGTLAAEIAKLATKEELREEIAKEIAKLATKEELREAVAKLATKEELRESLELWAGALEARLQAHFGAELARHSAAIIEAVTSQIRALDDKYKDLPPRVSRLEDIEARRAARRRPRQS